MPKPPGNIVLIGFMGTGKSTVGRALAKHLHRDFIDMDAEIEARTQRCIPDIFAEDGEATFRDMESALALELAGRKKTIISTGGGIVLRPENLEALEASGTLVCLSASAELILERVAHHENRPLLAGDSKLEKIRALYEARKPLYDAIPLQIHTDGLPADGVAAEVLRHLMAI